MLPRDQPTRASLATPATMGLETEKADVQLFMADDAYSHHSVVDYADPEKYVDSSQDRDPHQLNSHLKVSFRLGSQSPGLEAAGVHGMLHSTSPQQWELVPLLWLVPLALCPGPTALGLPEQPGMCV